MRIQPRHPRNPPLWNIPGTSARLVRQRDVVQLLIPLLVLALATCPDPARWVLEWALLIAFLVFLLAAALLTGELHPL